MKEIRIESLLECFLIDSRHMLTEAIFLKSQRPDLLNSPPAAGAWSVAQVFEHLNSYSRIYLPAIEKGMQEKLRPVQQTHYRPGRLGAYFTKMMKPDKVRGVTNKMKALKNHRPMAALDADAVITEFIGHQERLIQLLEAAAKADWQAIKIPTSLSRWLKLNLGDTFAFFIAHQDRHLWQIQHTWEAVQDGPVLGKNFKQAIG